MSQFTKGYTFGLFTGALIGSVIGLLYAPDKGKTLRDKLSYRMNSVLEDLSDTVNKIRNQEAEPASQSSKMVKEAKEKAEDLIREAEDLLKNINESKK